MIVREDVPRNVSRLGTVLLCLIGLAVIPGWLPGQETAQETAEESAAVADGASNEAATADVAENESTPVQATETSEESVLEPPVAESSAPSQSSTVESEVPVLPSRTAAPPAPSRPNSPRAPNRVRATASPRPSGRSTSPHSVATGDGLAPFQVAESEASAKAHVEKVTRAFRLEHAEPFEMLVLLRGILGRSIVHGGSIVHGASRENSDPYNIRNGELYSRTVERATNRAVEFEVKTQQQDKSDDVRIRIVRRPADKQAVKMVRLLGGRLRVIADVRTKSLIARGPEEDVQSVADLLEVLDTPNEVPQAGSAKLKNGQIFMFQHRQADEMAEILEGLGFAVERSDQPWQTYQSFGYLPTGEPQFQPRRPKGEAATLRFDKASPPPGGVIVATGPEAELEQLATLISHLDVAPKTYPNPTAPDTAFEDSAEDAAFPDQVPAEPEAPADFDAEDAAFNNGHDQLEFAPE